ncbi:MAG: hypothetical protein N3D10_01190 [Candidatus Micrarchaeota archaeon]|nr:hypothetical protein [Candidatus Micrarchaeota archaeon]
MSELKTKKLPIAQLVREVKNNLKNIFENLEYSPKPLIYDFNNKDFPKEKQAANINKLIFELNSLFNTNGIYLDYIIITKARILFGGKLDKSHSLFHKVLLTSFEDEEQELKEFVKKFGYSCAVFWETYSAKFDIVLLNLEKLFPFLGQSKK